MHSRIFFLFIIIFALSGCASDTTEEPAELVDFDPEATIKRLWKVDTGSGIGESRILLRPWYSSISIFVADTKGQLVALDKETGKTKWKVDVDTPLIGGVGGGSNMIFVGTDNGHLLAFWQRNGELAWEIDLAGEMLAPPAAVQGIVVARLTDGSLKAFSAATGEPLWTHRFSVPSLSLVGTAAPVIYSGGVICGGDDGRLTVVRLDNGQILWDVPVAANSGFSELSRVIDIDIPVVIDEPALFTAAYQGRIAAIAIRNGQILWARDGSVHLPMSLDDENLYVVDSRSFVWALGKFGGTTLWVQEALRARPASGAATYKGMIVLGDFEGYLHALDASDGRIIARKKFGDAIYVEPYADGDRLYVINQKGDLSALTIERIASDG